MQTHSSGLSDSVRPVKYDDKRSEQSYLELVKNAAVNNLENNSFEYSDTGSNVLGGVINAISGDRYEKYIHENILIPAGMQSNQYFNGINENIAEAPPTFKGKLIDKSERRAYDLSFNPSEGLVSNVYDLSLWLKRTLANDISILKQQTYKNMLAPQIETTWGGIYMGIS